MPALEAELNTYATLQESLENDSMGQWVLIKGDTVVGILPAFEEAAAVAVERFGRGPYLIRQIGSGTLSLPASAAFFR